ncbi:hypothetical protein D3C81_1923980 [compost metagenome]
MHKFHGNRLELTPHQRAAIHQQTGEELLDRKHLHIGKWQTTFSIEMHLSADHINTGHHNPARGVLMTNA